MADPALLLWDDLEMVLSKLAAREKETLVILGDFNVDPVRGDQGTARLALLCDQLGLVHAAETRHGLRTAREVTTRRGASAAVGGLASARDCTPRRGRLDARLGDVCVSHVSTNYDAMQSSMWDYKDDARKAGAAQMCNSSVAFPPTDPGLMGGTASPFDLFSIAACGSTASAWQTRPSQSSP